MNKIIDSEFFSLSCTHLRENVICDFYGVIDAMTFRQTRTFHSFTFVIEKWIVQRWLFVVEDVCVEIIYSVMAVKGNFKLSYR